MQVIYIAGKYRAKTERELVENIRHAEAAAIRLWKRGYAVICPHMNSAHMGGTCPDQVFIDGDLEILKRCDAIYMLDNCTESEGAKLELATAAKNNKLIYFEWDNSFGEYGD